MKILNEFLEARDVLFKEIDDDEYAQTVCVEHLRFIPCRRCLYSEVATVPYSSKEEDIKIVKEHQCRSGC